jgi:hypothetical protein
MRPFICGRSLSRAIARPSGARSPKYVVLSHKFDSLYRTEVYDR